MIRYDGFIMYFPLEELTKIVNLGKKLGQKSPFFHAMTHILRVIFGLV